MVGCTFSEVAWLPFMLSLEDVTGLYTCLLNAAHRNCQSTQAPAFKRAGNVQFSPHLRPPHSHGHVPGSSNTRGFGVPPCTDIT